MSLVIGCSIVNGGIQKLTFIDSAITVFSLIVACCVKSKSSRVFCSPRDSKRSALASRNSLFVFPSHEQQRARNTSYEHAFLITRSAAHSKLATSFLLFRFSKCCRKRAAHCCISWLCLALGLLAWSLTTIIIRLSTTLWVLLARLIV